MNGAASILRRCLLVLVLHASLAPIDAIAFTEHDSVVDAVCLLQTSSAQHTRNEGVMKRLRSIGGEQTTWPIEAADIFSPELQEAMRFAVKQLTGVDIGGNSTDGAFTKHEVAASKSTTGDSAHVMSSDAELTEGTAYSNETTWPLKNHLPTTLTTPSPLSIAIAKEEGLPINPAQHRSILPEECCCCETSNACCIMEPGEPPSTVTFTSHTTTTITTTTITFTPEPTPDPRLDTLDDVLSALKEQNKRLTTGEKDVNGVEEMLATPSPPPTPPPRIVVWTAAPGRPSRAPPPRTPPPWITNVPPVPPE